jgi:hypothetical protein
MRKRWLWLGWVLFGAVTLVGLGRWYASNKPKAVQRPAPAMSEQATDVAQWVDRGLLDLAQRDLAPSAESPSGDAGSLDEDEDAVSLEAQRDRLYRTLSFELGVTAEQLHQIRAIIEASAYFGAGNPAVSVHPMSLSECRARRAQGPLSTDDSRICGAINMVALYDPLHEEPATAKVCIDQFEFPNVPCEYPLVWVRANEAAQICRILDKRLCDAHEWEGACAGKIDAPSTEYDAWSKRLLAELNHNQSRKLVWATGYQPDARTCATGSTKSPGCVGVSWQQCGTNSYPTGAFPRCVSPFGVYDQHGNVAEHMNLPLAESQLGSQGGSGETEMKGSWFAFDEYRPHADDCRWRAPSWHVTPVESKVSHYNYHLGFRCCKDLD